MSFQVTTVKFLVRNVNNSGQTAVLPFKVQTVFGKPENRSLTPIIYGAFSVIIRGRFGQCRLGVNPILDDAPHVHVTISSLTMVMSYDGQCY